MTDVTANQFQTDVNDASGWTNGDENHTQTFRLGQAADSPAKTIAGINERANTEIRNLVDGFNLSPSGFDFATGGTITSNAQTIEDSNGNEWVYTPEIPQGGHVVAPGTDPTTSNDYKQVSYRRAVDIDWTQYGVNSEQVAGCVAITSAQIKSLQNTTERQLFFVSDKFGGSFWRFKSVSQVVDGQTSTNITFDDERSISITSGGYLVFDDNLNDGVISRLESENYAKHIANLYARDVTFNINCYGDSITYGQALPNSAGATNRIGQPTNYGDGSTFNHWQFNAAWPQVLQSELNKYMQTNCTVTNRGYSGARCYTGYLMHRSPAVAGVSTIMYGVNEVLFATNNGANLNGIRTNNLDGVEAYKQAVKRFAIREILRGNTVILMSALNFSSATGWDGSIASSTKAHKAYDEQLKAVANELGLTLINWKEEITNSYAANRITQDGVHPSTNGHLIIGAKLAAPLLSGHRFVEKVESGSKLLSNSGISNVFQPASQGVVTLSNASSYTPPFLGSEPQTVNVTNTKPLVFTFYAAEDDLIVWPEMMVNNTTATIKLINGYEQSEYLLDGAINKPVSFNPAFPASATSSPDSDKTITETSAVRHGQMQDPVYTDGNGFIHISTKGYYTLSIENSGASGLLVDGLSFLSFEQAKIKHNNPMCTFNGSGSVIEQKLIGISSITRVDAGRYDIFFENSAPDDDYAFSAIARAPSIGSGVRLLVDMPAGDSGNITTQKCRIEVIDISTGNRTDAESVRVMFDFGVR